MQHAVPRKNFQLPVVHSHGDVQRNLFARPLQKTVQALLESQFARGYFKARFRVLVDIHLFRHRGLRHAKFSFADFPSSLSLASQRCLALLDCRARDHTPAHRFFHFFRTNGSLHKSPRDFFTGVILRPRKVSFSGLPHRQTCHLAGPPVYEPVLYPASQAAFTAAQHSPVFSKHMPVLYACLRCA